MERKGYKSFNKNRQNRYGVPFEEGCTYRVDGTVSFGNSGNGFHFCKNICDVFRYADDPNEAEVALVVGMGDIVEYNDEYYGYYDMYASQEITIERFLSREEIIGEVLNSSDIDAMKFLGFVKLSEEELRLVIDRFSNNMMLLEWIMYCQLGHKDIYRKNYMKREEYIRKVLSYGQNSN